MANFVLLYSGGSRPQSEAEQEKIMQAWGEWYGGMGEAVADGGNPFTPVAKSISGDGTVKDGPVGTMATGYTIIKAGSLDAAVDLARACPVLQGGGQISVYETIDM